MENYKEYLTNLLTELITKYVELEWNMSFITWYINSDWNYVTLQERTDSTWIDYSIRSTMLDSEYWTENEIEWWEIIFQFDENYSYVYDELLEDHKQDYKNLLNNKNAYIKAKVDYIIYLTYWYDN